MPDWARERPILRGTSTRRQRGTKGPLISSAASLGTRCRRSVEADVSCDGSGASRLDARRCHGYSRGRPLLPPSSRHPRLHRDWIWFQMGTRLPGDPAGFVAESRTGARPEHRRPSLCSLVSDFQGPSSDLHLRRELQGQKDLALREQQERGSIRTHSFADRFQRLRGCRRLAGRSGTWNSGSRRRPQGPGRGRSFRPYSTGHLSLSDLPRRMTRK